MTQMTSQRPRLAIDLEPETVRAIKVAAYANGMSVREFILRTLADKYPTIRVAVDKDLKKS